MATLKIVAPNQDNESVLVNVRVTHKRKHRFINTNKYIDKSELGPNGDVPVDFIIDYLASDYKLYKDRLKEIKDINSLTVDEVKSILENGENIHTPEHVRARTDFIIEADKIIKIYEKSKVLDKEDSTVDGYKRSLKKFKEFFGESVLLPSITRKSVIDWYKWMIEIDEVKLNTAKLYYYRVNRLFKDIMEEINDWDDEFIVIKHNPFDAIKPPKEKSKKRDLVPLNYVRLIRDYQVVNVQVGRTLFLLSLYLCGTNFADIYDGCERWLETGVVEYERRKVRKKRDDSAFISMLLTPEVETLLICFIHHKKAYPGKVKLYDRISLEVGYLERDLNIPVHIVPYSARYIFGNVASDECDIRDDYVTRAMNHKKPEMSETSGYLHNHWRKIHETQLAVIAKINEDLKA